MTLDFHYCLTFSVFILESTSRPGQFMLLWILFDVDILRLHASLKLKKYPKYKYISVLS
jgi:hypothetical protein